ncbi:MAG: sulfate ABC transporter substrate-binding protein, partial [Nocardioidaceae bacterium]
MRTTLKGAVSIGAVASLMALAACGGGSAAGSGSTTLHLVAYSVPQLADEAIEKQWATTPAGKGTHWQESYGASGDQSRAVEG